MENNQHLILIIKKTEEELFIKLWGKKHGVRRQSVFLFAREHIFKNSPIPVSCIIWFSTGIVQKNGGKLHLKGCSQHKIQLPLEVIGASLDA